MRQAQPRNTPSYSFNTSGPAVASSSSSSPSSPSSSSFPRQRQNHNSSPNNMNPSPSFGSYQYRAHYGSSENLAPSSYDRSPPVGLNSRGGSGGAGNPLLGTPSSASAFSRDSIASRSSTNSYYQASMTPSTRTNRSDSVGTVSEKFVLPADPSYWGADEPEADDYLHNPTPRKETRGTIFTWRGIANLGCMLVLVLALLMLFAGYPVYSELTKNDVKTLGAFNLGGINGSGQVPQMVGGQTFGLIDPATPLDKRTSISRETGELMELVFSDEFNTDGRSFFPGDDPYWEAQVTTEGGNLKITLDQIPNHDLNYTGGMLSTWRKFCFTGGYVETSLQLPGRSNVPGLWPAVWIMGNLGRAGYGGTLDGMWPYSYDSCDVGTVMNQTIEGLPEISTTSGSEWAPGFGALSYLPGQRLSRCTCPDDETHPGPKHPDGSWVGRSAPEIDMLEAQVDAVTFVGHVSMSSQWAPFNPEYDWLSTDENMIIEDPELSYKNTYSGGVYQQSSSVVVETDQNCYQYGAVPCFSMYAFEYLPGNDGYISWFADDKHAWTYKAAGMGPNADAEVSMRPVPQEPMYILANLGISENFGAVDYDGLEPDWPFHLLIDYIRVYQPANAKNIGCDPPDFPTEAYIERYIHGYTNANITTWDQLTDNAPTPVNRLTGTC